MKKIIALLLITVLCVSLGAMNAGAALPPYHSGDVNWDGSLDIVDVTLVQRYLVDIITFNDVTEKPMADFDHDSYVTVLDATWMQRSLAGIQIPENVGGIAQYFFEIRSFSASYDSGKAAVGVPVTLSVDAYNPFDPDGWYPLRYDFYIGGELIQSDYKNSVVVTFDSAGSYALQVKVYNWQGFSEEYNNYRYQVVADVPDDGITFKRLTFKEREGMSYTPTLITEAMGGTAPYTYSLKFYHFNKYSDYLVTGLTDEEVANISAYLADHPDPSWSFETDEYGRRYLYREFVSAEETQWSMEMFPYAEAYRIYVQARDNTGAYSLTNEIDYFNAVAIG